MPTILAFGGARNPARSTASSKRALECHELTQLQIAESFRRFGITEETRSLICIKISDSLTSDSVRDHLAHHVGGVSIPFTDEELEGITDFAKVRKIYKLNASGGGAGRKGAVKGAQGCGTAVNGTAHAQHGRQEMESTILGLMALKGL